MSYQSHADLGGKTITGAIVAEAEAELFHAAWEPRVLALTLAMGAAGRWNIDASRSARETLPNYLQLSYYQIWLSGLEKLLLERGLVFVDELAEGHTIHPAAAVAQVLTADKVEAALASGSPTLRPTTAAARFSAGQKVRTRATVVEHHSRLPAYVHGKTGVVERVHGCHVFAESHAHGLGEQPQWLYCVAFDGKELWGAEAGADLSVSVDAWESTLSELT